MALCDKKNKEKTRSLSLCQQGAVNLPNSGLPMKSMSVISRRSPEGLHEDIAEKKFHGRICHSGDKSITHRAIMFNAIAEGEADITGALLGEDCLSTAACMRALGAKVEIEEGRVHVCGAETLQDASLDCGNSGTTMRLLMGLCAGKRVSVTLTGDESLSKRPMERWQNLCACSARIYTRRKGARP